MRVEELAPQFGILLQEELEKVGRYGPEQIRAARIAHERRILDLLREAYGAEISAIEAFVNCGNT